MGRLPKLTVRAAADYVLHEAEEWLPGRIVDITVTEDNMGYGEGLKFIIYLDDDELQDDGSERETWAFSSQKVSRKSKLGKWGLAILKDEYPEEGEAFDLNLLLQVPIEVMFEQYKGKDSEDNEVIKEKVVKIRAAKKTTAKARATAPVEDADDDDDEVSPASLKAKQAAAKAARQAKSKVEPF